MSLGSSLKYHLLKLSSCSVYVCGTVRDSSYTELQMETADFAESINFLKNGAMT